MSGILAENSGRNTGLVKASSAGGTWNLIQTQTASSSSTISFTSGIDSTYSFYVFKFYNIHPSDDGAEFQFQGNASGGSGYNETITSTHFDAIHGEDGGSTAVSYMTGFDQAQGTAFDTLSRDVGNDNDQAASGHLELFAPASTVHVKHFISDFSNSINNDQAVRSFHAGYFNTTSAISEIQFKYSAGTIDSGQISLFGLTI